jgi:hypothetical protein
MIILMGSRVHGTIPGTINGIVRIVSLLDRQTNRWGKRHKTDKVTPERSQCQKMRLACVQQLLFSTGLVHRDHSGSEN